ncbi:hypothetical protein [Lysobacter sp. A289]
MKNFLRRASYEALLSVVAGVLLANAFILVTSLEHWEQLILGAGPWVFLGCLVLSVFTLAMIYFKKAGRHRRERAVLLLLVLLLSVMTGALSGVFHGDFNAIAKSNQSVAVTMIFGYGTLVVSFGVAAIAANLFADLFKKI